MGLVSAVNLTNFFTGKFSQELIIEESILLSNASVETRSVKLWCNVSGFVHYFLYNRWRQWLNTISLKIDSARYNSATSKFKLLG